MLKKTSCTLFCLSLAIIPLSCITAGKPARPPGVSALRGSDNTTNRVVTPSPRKVFSFTKSGVFVSTEFDGARLNAVSQTGAGEFTALIAPENFPVNDAAWFAFKIWSPSNQTVRVKLTYKDGEHRYHPKISRGRANWKPLDDADYTTSRLENTATLKLEIGSQPIFVSGQELLTSKFFADWIQELSKKPFIKTGIIGKSVRGKPIRKFEISEAGGDAQYLFIVSRQHPPEVTGTLALHSFIKTICDDTPLAKKFRAKFTTVVIPLMNPDGVDAGHWRHNANGVDLNRDWGQFNQPETRAARDEFLRIGKNSHGKVRFGMDFHSTHHDVFYPFSDKEGLMDAWLEQIKKRVPDYKMNIEPSHNQRDAITFVSVGWMNRQFKIPAVTYEIGDETDRAVIEKVATNAATALMELLLAK